MVEDVLKEYDPIHRLSELSATWTTLATSFGEKLQVDVLPCLLFLICGCSFCSSFLTLPLFLLGLFSRSVDFLWF